LLELESYQSLTQHQALDFKLANAHPSEAELQDLWSIISNAIDPGSELPANTDGLMKPGCVNLVVATHVARPEGEGAGAEAVELADSKSWLGRCAQRLTKVGGTWSGPWDVSDGSHVAQCAGGAVQALARCPSPLCDRAAPLAVRQGQPFGVRSAEPLLYHTRKCMDVAKVSQGVAYVPREATESLRQGLVGVRPSRYAQPLNVLVVDDSSLAAELNAYAQQLGPRHLRMLRAKVVPDVAWLLESEAEGWVYWDKATCQHAKRVCDQLMGLASAGGLAELLARLEVVDAYLEHAEEVHRGMEKTVASVCLEWLKSDYGPVERDREFHEWAWTHVKACDINSAYMQGMFTLMGMFQAILVYQGKSVLESFLHASSLMLFFVTVNVLRSASEFCKRYGTDLLVLAWFLHGFNFTLNLHFATPESRLCAVANPAGLHGFSKLNFMFVNMLFLYLSKPTLKQHYWSTGLRLLLTVTSRLLQPVRCGGAETQIFAKLAIELCFGVVVDTVLVYVLARRLRKGYETMQERLHAKAE